MVVLLLLTSLFSPGFLSPGHLRSIAVLAAFIGIVALGQTFVIIGGGIDLSVPWVLNCAAILVTLLAGGQDAPLLWAIPLSARRGRADRHDQRPGRRALRRAADHHDACRQRHPAGRHPRLYRRRATRRWRRQLIQFLAVGRIASIPVVLFIWAALAAVAALLLLRRRPSAASSMRSARAPTRGGVFRACRRCAPPSLAYTLSGFTAALAGMLLTGYTGQAYLGMGDPYLFTSIAAVAIGGASILGGSGHYVGTIAGAFVLTILTGLLPALNLSNGALLIVYGAGHPRHRLACERGFFRHRSGNPRRPQARDAAGRTIGRQNAMIEIECVVDAKAVLGEATYWDRAGRRAVVDRHLRTDDPPLRPDDRQGRHLAGAGISRHASRSASAAGSSLSMASGFYFFDPKSGTIRPRSSIRKRDIADYPLQRRQDRPARPLLVGLACSRRPGKEPAKIASAIAARPRPLGPQRIGRGHRLLQRARLEPRQPHHVFHRQPHPPRLGVGFRPGERRDRQPPRLHRPHREDYIVDGATVDAEGNYWLTVPVQGQGPAPTTRRAS